MPLDPNRFTRKTGEALQAAQALAREQNHSQVTPEHLLAALVSQPEGVVLPVLERVGVPAKTVRDRVEEALQNLPKVYGQTAQQAQLSQDAYRILEAADQERTGLDDDYLSTEHVLLAMSEVTGGVGDLLRGLGVRPETARVSGGGARSDLWLRIVASALGVPVERTAVEEGAAYGAALLGGVASGVFADVHEAVGACVRVRETIEPDASWQEVYEDGYPRFRALYPALR